MARPNNNPPAPRPNVMPVPASGRAPAYNRAPPRVAPNKRDTRVPRADPVVPLGVPATLADRAPRTVGGLSIQSLRAESGSNAARLVAAMGQPWHDSTEVIILPQLGEVGYAGISDVVNIASFQNLFTNEHMVVAAIGATSINRVGSVNTGTGLIDAIGTTPLASAVSLAASVSATATVGFGINFFLTGLTTNEVNVRCAPVTLLPTANPSPPVGYYNDLAIPRLAMQGSRLFGATSAAPPPPECSQVSFIEDLNQTLQSSRTLANNTTCGNILIYCTSSVPFGVSITVYQRLNTRALPSNTIAVQQYYAPPTDTTLQRELVQVARAASETGAASAKTVWDVAKGALVDIAKTALPAVGRALWGAAKRAAASYFPGLGFLMLDTHHRLATLGHTRAPSQHHDDANIVFERAMAIGVYCARHPETQPLVLLDTLDAHWARLGAFGSPETWPTPTAQWVEVPRRA